MPTTNLTRTDFSSNQLLRYAVSLLVPVIVALAGGLITYGAVQSRVADQDRHIQSISEDAQTDHDLLIRVDTRVAAINAAVSEIKESVKRIDERTSKSK